jgi:ribosomal protein S18 acetylase RimI-like enzyme
MTALLTNPFWHSLRTEHANLALGSGLARRFPADVIPFASLAETSPAAMESLRDLLTPGETLYVTAESLPPCAGLEPQGEIPCWQMFFTGSLPAPAQNLPAIEPLDLHNVDAMVALTDVAFPGFFRQRTPILGHYFGIRHNGELIAMAGERIALPGLREISAVCTHPAHTGKGLAAHLVSHNQRLLNSEGLQSFLHAAQKNDRAVHLYQRLGFTTVRPLRFHRLRRS